MEVILGLGILFPAAWAIRLSNSVHDLGRDLASEDVVILTGLIMLLWNGCFLRSVLNEEDQRNGPWGMRAFPGQDGGLDTNRGKQPLASRRALLSCHVVAVVHGLSSLPACLVCLHTMERFGP